MKREAKIRLAKVMIAFSYVLIFIGLSFHLESSYKVQDPIKDTKVIASTSKESVHITTIDGKEPDSSNLDEENKSNQTPSTDSKDTENQTPQTNNPSSAGSNNTTNNNATNNNPVNPPTVVSPPVTNTPVTPTPTPTPSIEQTNNELRNNLQQTYGITIKYGNETTGYSVGGLQTIAMTDSYAIQTTLNNLANNMALYPSNFFREFNNSGFTLTIYLIKNYSSGNVTGVTDSSTANVAMSIATDYSFSESFNHEMYHYIDDYIYHNNGRYTTWNSLNPTGFIYGNINQNYSYSATFSADAFFVNNYAQTDQYEDRASTFEYMMTNSKASCLEYGKPIWLKAKYMSEQIDLFFNTVSPNVTEHWERFIY